MAKLNCIIWKKGKTGSGYGAIYVNKSQQSYPAHRFLYEQKFGKLPKNIQIDHLCRVRACVNLDHLEAVTPIENYRRGKLSKINMKDAQNIRKIYKEEKIKQIDLAKIYKIGQDEISRIINFRRWSL